MTQLQLMTVRRPLNYPDSGLFQDSAYTQWQTVNQIFQSTHPEADELNVFLSDDKLRSVSGIDSDQEQDSSVTAVEQEALQLANNFKGPGHNFASVTIDKNNIFLGATVKNDDAKVVISRIVAGGAVENDGRLQEGKN